MEWLKENSFWVIVFVLFIGMHLFGHGGHGGHGGGQRRRRDTDETEDTGSGGHKH